MENKSEKNDIINNGSDALTFSIPPNFCHAQQRRNNISGNNVLIIGGSGSLGNQLTKNWINHNRINIYSRGETKQWTMKKKFPNAKYFIGDLCDTDHLMNVILTVQPNIIIIACALKHVEVCEEFIYNSVQINVIGIQNLLNRILNLYNTGVKLDWLDTVLYTSTDKAVEPITVYGNCKLISERLMYNMAKHFKDSHIRFITTRYGNVFSSNGSLFNVFTNIGLDSKKPTFTVTHPDMTRFFMTLDESVKLIEKSIIHGNNGEIWVSKLNSFKIMDLAEYFSKRYNKTISIIGLRGIEKIHEKLISSHEESQTYEYQDNYVVIPRFMAKISDNKKTIVDYSSENTVIQFDFEKIISEL
jgi:UDP-N-acetylglucosamine 4,6-dehydratase/5-epimerase